MTHDWIKNCSNAKTRWIKIIYFQDLKVNRRKNRLLFNYREIPDSVACKFILSGKDISSNCLISMITVSYSQLDGWVPVRQSIKTESKCIGFQTQFLNNFIPTVFSIIFHRTFSEGLDKGEISTLFGIGIKGKAG